MTQAREKGGDVFAGTDNETIAHSRPSLTLSGIGERIAALLVLTVFAVPAALTALLVWTTLGRPLMFRQIRSGLDGRNFTVVKFRTMNDQRDSNGQLLPDRERETRLTRLVRRLRFDEVPQLLTILNGQMSFIGPRPLLPVTVSTFGEWGVTRGRVRPGLTGWAQVNGGTRLTNIEKLALDLWFIEHQTMRLNAWVLVLTAVMLVRGERIRRKPLAEAQAYLIARSRKPREKGNRFKERRQIRVALAGAPDLVARARGSLEDSGQEPALMIDVPIPPEAGSNFARSEGTCTSNGGEAATGATRMDEAEFSALLHAFDPDLLLILDRPELYSPKIGSIPRLGTIGFHPSPLPLMRGRSAVPWAILKGVQATGASLYWMVEAGDTGPILLQTPVMLDAGETATSLWRKQADALALMLPSALDLIRTGNPPKIDQDHERATFCEDLRPQEGLIDWNDSAEAVLRRIRAFDGFHTGAFTSFDGRNLFIEEAVPWSCDENAEGACAPGEVRVHTNLGFVVCCGNGNSIEVTKWRGDDAQARPGPHAVLGGEA